jgi:HD-like signal output (HDOD) protein
MRAMIETPPASLESWVEHLGGADIPVLRRTARELAALREREEQIGAREIAVLVLQDPLMAARLLAHVAGRRRPRQTTDITTIDRAIMMLGITPFFTAFEQLPIVEEHLAAQPKALLALLRVVTRARRAAHLARDWAMLRHDLDIDEIVLAALLHDIAEVMLWCLAPALALRLAPREAAQLAQAEAQAEVLGVTVPALQQALCERWHLPQLLRALTNDARSASPRIRNVALAVALARDLAGGKVPPEEAFDAVGELLHLPAEAVMMRLGIDAYALPEPTQPQ